MKTNFSEAFIDGRIIESENRPITLKVHEIGKLVVTTGQIVACDPFVFFDTRSFNISVPIGTYPVILSVASLGTDQRVAYAKLQITDQVPLKWEMAVLPGQDASSLEEGEYFGYPVDAGIGSFMDEKAAKALLEKDESYSDFILDEMEKNYTSTWDWTDLKLDAETGANLIAFTSGYGDGTYPSYFGFNAEGKVTSLITDFLIID